MRKSQRAGKPAPTHSLKHSHALAVRQARSAQSPLNTVFPFIIIQNLTFDKKCDIISLDLKEVVGRL